MRRFHLSRAEMVERRHKRQFIERGRLDFWHRRGRGSFHLENVHLMKPFLCAALRITRLFERGKRNALAVRVREVCFSLPKLPEAFEGFRLLHLSDLHLDGAPGLTDRLVNLLAGFHVDLCVLTGDYRFDVSGSCEEAWHELKRLIPAIDSRFGKVGILGNHDFLELAVLMEQAGVKMLMNSHLEVRNNDESIWIIGIDDPHYYGCDDLPQAVKGVPDGSFKILLVHTPEMLREAHQAGISLYLCGHTHAGQICLPWIGPLVINADCRRSFVSGTWRYGEMCGYTNPGCGTSLLPVRFLCPPEITLITLHR